MISRQWRGLADPARADEYVHHLRRDTFPQLKSLSGFVDASILRRDLSGGTEFLVVTRWQSLRAIESFAGEDCTVAVVPDRVKDMMIEYDRNVIHYEVVQ